MDWRPAKTSDDRSHSQSAIYTKLECVLLLHVCVRIEQVPRSQENSKDPRGLRLQPWEPCPETEQPHKGRTRSHYWMGFAKRCSVKRLSAKTGDPSVVAPSLLCCGRTRKSRSQEV